MPETTCRDPEGKTVSATYTIDELSVSASTDDPEFAGFAEVVELRDEVEATTPDSWALSGIPEELPPRYQRREYDPKRVFVVRTEGKFLARGVLEWSGEEGTNVSWVSVELLLTFRGRGIGGTIVQTDAIHTNTGDPATAQSRRVVSGLESS